MDLSRNANRFSGVDNVKVYDRYRPTPPQALIDLTMQYANDSIDHLVDIGCGSGLSTAVWIDHVHSLSAADPSEDMLAAAKQKLEGQSNFNAIQAYGNDIPLNDQCADVVTCSQAFHWMEPMSTLAEINRLLKDEGVLVIYDCMWPPSIHSLWEQAFISLFDRIKKIANQQPEPLMHFWDKKNHLKNVQNSGYFKYIKQVGFHKEVQGNVDYFIGLAESQGGLQALRKIGMSDEEIGWKQFQNIIQNNPLNEGAIFVLNYSAIFAIK